MLLIKTKVGPSSIEGAGLGLFADEFIAKGTLIWEVDPNFDVLVSKKNLEDDFINYPESYRIFLKTYGYTKKEYPFIIICTDNARFVNHSKEGNMKGGEGNFSFMEQSYASRDIYPGEELLEDYSSFDDKSMGEENNNYY